MKQLWQSDNNGKQDNRSSSSFTSLALSSVSSWVLQTQMPTGFRQRMEIIKKQSVGFGRGHRNSQIALSRRAVVPELQLTAAMKSYRPVFPERKHPISQQRLEIQIFVGKLSFFKMWKLLLQNLVTQEAPAQTKRSVDMIPHTNHLFVPASLHSLQGSYRLYHFVFKDCGLVSFLKESTKLIVQAETIYRSSSLIQGY